MRLILSILLTFSVANGHPSSECGPDSPKTRLDKAFLDAHNVRREKFHNDYGVSYVP